MQVITGPRQKAMQTCSLINIDLHKLEDAKYIADIQCGFECKAIIYQYRGFWRTGLIVCMIDNAHLRERSDPIELKQVDGDLKQVKDIAEFLEKELKLPVIVRTR